MSLTDLMPIWLKIIIVIAGIIGLWFGWTIPMLKESNKKNSEKEEKEVEVLMPKSTSSSEKFKVRE